MAVTQYYLAQSLDGYLAESDGSIEWLMTYGAEDAPEGEGGVSAATDGTYDEFYSGIGAIAMGSATYEFLLEHSAESWPYPEVHSWVFSSREQPNPYGEAPIEFVSGPVGPHHERMLEAASGRNVWIVGGGALASQFAAAGLLDELIVTVVPVVLGSGLPTFAERLGGPLRTIASRQFANGMIELRFEFVR